MTITRWLPKKETKRHKTNKQTNVLSQFRSSIIDENEIAALNFNCDEFKNLTSCTKS